MHALLNVSDCGAVCDSRATAVSITLSVVRTRIGWRCSTSSLPNPPSAPSSMPVSPMPEIFPLS